MQAGASAGFCGSRSSRLLPSDLRERRSSPNFASAEDASDDGEVAEVRGIEGDLGRCTAWKIVGGDVVKEFDDSGNRRPPGRVRPCLARSRSPEAALVRLRRAHFALSLEYTPWHGIEGDFRLITGSDALQGILLKPSSQCAIIVVHEDHHRPQRRRNDVHAGSQSQLRHEARARSPDRGVFQIKFRILEVCAQARH